jgi:hypothetical protein
MRWGEAQDWGSGRLGCWPLQHAFVFWLLVNPIKQYFLASASLPFAGALDSPSEAFSFLLLLLLYTSLTTAYFVPSKKVLYCSLPVLQQL